MRTTPEPSLSAAGTELGAFTAHIDPTPLGRINQLAVDHLTLTVPSTLIDGDTPVVPLTLLDLRIRLLRRSTPGEIRDRAWRHIGQLARAERGDWNLFALGLAYPGLRARAWRLTEGLSFHRAAQVHFRLAGEFLFALHRLGLDKPNVASRLIGAAYDQASGRKKRAEPVIIGLDEDTPNGPDEIVYPPSEDGPRRVLDRLVSSTRSASDGQQITELHATLIAHLPRRGQAQTGRRGPGHERIERLQAPHSCRSLNRPSAGPPRPYRPAIIRMTWTSARRTSGYAGNCSGTGSGRSEPLAIASLRSFNASTTRSYSSAMACRASALSS